MKNILVIVDPGHGGVDEEGNYVTAGKRSPNWKGEENPVHNKDIYYEGEGNMDIANLVVEALKAEGINVALTRSNHQDIPLSARVGIANQLALTNECFLISIHSNAGGGKGIEVFTSPGETKSDKMATLCIEEFKNYFPDRPIRKDYSDGDPDKEALFTMLTKTSMPAFLPEAFFMDTEEECVGILMSREGRELIAKWYVSTIKRIINELY